MDLNNNRPKMRWQVFAFLAIIAVLLFLFDRSGNSLGVITDPITSAMERTDVRTDAIAESLSGPDSLDQARQQISDLRFRLDQLERENEELRTVQGEYERLLGLFNRTLETPDLERVLAYVIGRGANPLFHDVLIDRGSVDGVRVGMAVESARGLVGQMYRTTQNSGQVVLLTDSISRVPARLADTRATGIVSGGGVGGLLVMDWIDLETQITLGEIVVTSGLGSESVQEESANRFPAGIVIGKVIEIERNEAELFQRAIIQPAVDFDELEITFVITDFNPVDTSTFDELEQQEQVP
jgi:rod shape-determining protein MreC